MRTVTFINTSGFNKIDSWVADEDCVLVGVFVSNTYAVVSLNADPLSHFDNLEVEQTEFVLVANGVGISHWMGGQLNFPIVRNQRIYVGFTSSTGTVQLMIEAVATL